MVQYFSFLHYINFYELVNNFCHVINAKEMINNDKRY